MDQIKTVPLIINGKLADGEEKSFRITSPQPNPPSVTSKYSIQNASKSQALRAAEFAYKHGMDADRGGWASLNPKKRRDLLWQAHEIFKTYREAHLESVAYETAISPDLAGFFFDTSVDYFLEMASLAGTAAESASSIQSSQAGKVPLVFSEPIGPVLAMAPWNAPGILAMRSVLTPLAAGCPVVFKSHEQCPLSQWFLMKCFYDMMKDGRLPPGTFTFLNCSEENTPGVVESLISSRFISKINFTGSIPVGRKIGEAAGRSLKPAVLELGGKGHCLICRDVVYNDKGEINVDFLEKLIVEVLIGCWLNKGQICMSTDTILVDVKIKEQFLEVVERVGEEVLEQMESASVDLRTQDDDDDIIYFGSVKGADRVTQLINDALGKGARLLLGDTVSNSGAGLSNKLKRCLLTDITNQMRISREEIFGPCAIVKFYGTLDEDNENTSIKKAIAIVNECEYGLTGSVWTKDISKGIAIARRLQCGAVHINGSVSYYIILIIIIFATIKGEV